MIRNLLPFLEVVVNCPRPTKPRGLKRELPLVQSHHRSSRMSGDAAVLCLLPVSSLADDLKGTRTASGFAER